MWSESGVRQTIHNRIPFHLPEYIARSFLRPQRGHQVSVVAFRRQVQIAWCDSTIYLG